jgi:uncharacterized protein YutE (UPF0331/DUF86 family)
MRKRLERLEENLRVLESLRESRTAEEINSLRDVQWSIRYGLMESIQIVIDVSCHLCGKFNLGSPENYGDCVTKIASGGYIPAVLAPRILSIIGLRNLLIHEYTVIDSRRLYDFLGDLGVFREFISSVAKVL